MRRVLALSIAAALSLVLTPSAQRVRLSPPDKRAYATLADPLSDAARGDRLPQIGFTAGRARDELAAAASLPVTIRTRPGRAAVVAALGITARQARDTVVEAFVSPSQLVALAAEPDVVGVDPIVPDQPRVVSEGLPVHHVPGVHARGYQGAGVKVGVIDTFLGFQALQGTELPVTITARCYAGIGLPTSTLSACNTGSGHGTAVAETLMDVAPAAQLFIANPISRLDFMDAMNWMAASGVKVINYSAARPWDGPGDGTSPFADSPLRAVDQAVAGGAVFVTAAGNEAEATWYGPFEDLDGDGFHNFGALNYTSVFLAAGWTYAAQLRWEDTWSASSRDLDIGLYDANLRLVAAATATQSGGPGHVPFEFVVYTPQVSGVYHLGLYRRGGAPPGWLQLQSFTGEPLTTNSRGRYSIGSPAESANPGSLAVGAAPWNAPTFLESFSSQGPTPDGRLKPDVVGVDRASTVTYGPNGFAGTSQASPHVAGLVALVRQEFPSFTPAQAASYLTSAAIERGAKPNQNWGYGLATGCSFDLSASTVLLGPVSPASVVQVATQGHCPWTVSSASPWLFGRPNPDTVGSGSVEIRATDNYSGLERTGALTVGGRAITVLQLGTADEDGDTLGDVWEELFGFDPLSPTGVDGATGDPDGDGRTNAVELAEGTHPRGTHIRYMAEGASNSFFSTRFSLLNPGTRRTTVVARLLTSTGAVLPIIRTLDPQRLDAIEGDVLTASNLDDTEFSSTFESDAPIVVDRTMTWQRGSSGYGSHSETALSAPAATWYLAEGATHSGFQLFYLLQNPSATTAATVQARFLLPSGAPIVRSYSVPPSSRFNIWANTVPELANTDVSAVFSSTNGVPVIVERAMYLNAAGRAFEAGHESAGVTAPSLSWYFAEGATGPYFDEYLLLANPDTRAAAVTLRFFLPSGLTITKTYTVAPASRFNIWVDAADARLADTAVSVEVVVTNGVPIIAERSMWWPGPTFASWREAHNSAGATATAASWAMAEGEVGGAQDMETYVLIANTSASTATVRVTAFTRHSLPVQKTFGVAASSRFNVRMRSEFPSLAGQRFGVLVESLGAAPAALVVERAMYGDSGYERWALGSNALATPWPPQ